MREIKKIIVHCSDSDALAHNDVNIIRIWHQRRGFKTVGYHKFIQFNGTVQDGRPISEAGAHCKGDNEDSIGICLHGSQRFQFDQFRSLAKEVEKMKAEYGLTNADVYAHCQRPSGKEQGKTCPNFDIDEFKKHYLQPDPITKKKKHDRKGNAGPGKGRAAGSKKRPAGTSRPADKKTADPDKK